MRIRNWFFPDLLYLRRLPVCPPQFLPHSHYALLQFRRQLLICRFTSLTHRRRHNRLPKHEPQIPRLRPLLMPRPDLIETFNRDRNNRRLLVDGENGRALAEHSWLAGVRALALWIEDQNPPLPQSVRPGAHRWDEVGIGIEHNHANPARQTPHDALAKNIARAESERVA